MNASYMKVVEGLNRLVEFKDRNAVAAIAVAWHVASELGLPSGAVENPTMHFFNAYSSGVRNKVSYMNETITMDARYCVELVQKFWLVRYYAAYPVERRLAYATILSTCTDFFGAALSTAKVMSPPETEMLNKYGVKILQLNVMIAECENEEA